MNWLGKSSEISYTRIWVYQLDMRGFSKWSDQPVPKYTRSRVLLSMQWLIFRGGVFLTPANDSKRKRLRQQHVYRAAICIACDEAGDGAGVEAEAGARALAGTGELVASYMRKFYACNFRRILIRLPKWRHEYECVCVCVCVSIGKYVSMNA